MATPPYFRDNSISTATTTTSPRKLSSMSPATKHNIVPKYKVYNTTELCEKISTHLPLSSISHTSATCQSSRNAIENSPTLQVRLFRKPQYPRQNRAYDKEENIFLTGSKATTFIVQKARETNTPPDASIPVLLNPHLFISSLLGDFTPASTMQLAQSKPSVPLPPQTTPSSPTSQTPKRLAVRSRSQSNLPPTHPCSQPNPPSSNSASSRAVTNSETKVSLFAETSSFSHARADAPTFALGGRGVRGALPRCSARESFYSEKTSYHRRFGR